MSLQIAIGLVISSICASKCNALGTLGIIPKDEKKIIYLGCLGGHTSNLAIGGILDSDTTPNKSKKKKH